MLGEEKKIFHLSIRDISYSAMNFPPQQVHAKPSFFTPVGLPTAVCEIGKNRALPLEKLPKIAICADG